MFANNWPPTAGVVFTVLVFADRNETLIAQHKDGQVFEDYFNTSAVSDLGIFLPDPHVVSVLRLAMRASFTGIGCLTPSVL